MSEMCSVTPPTMSPFFAWAVCGAFTTAPRSFVAMSAATRFPLSPPTLSYSSPPKSALREAIAPSALSSAPFAHFATNASNSASVVSANVALPVASVKAFITAALISAVCAALRPGIFASPETNAMSSSVLVRASAASASADVPPSAAPAAVITSWEGLRTATLTLSRRIVVTFAASASADAAFFVRVSMPRTASSSPNVNDWKSSVRPVPPLASALSASASEATSPFASATASGGKNAAAPSGSAAIRSRACTFCATSALMAAASPDAAPRRSPCAKSPISLRSA